MRATGSMFYKGGGRLQIVGDPEGGISVLDAHAPMNKKKLKQSQQKNDETLLEMVCLLQNACVCYKLFMPHADTQLASCTKQTH
jgi:hypothetical protein